MPWFKIELAASSNIAGNGFKLQEEFDKIYGSLQIPHLGLCGDLNDDGSVLYFMHVPAQSESLLKAFLASWSATSCDKPSGRHAFISGDDNVCK